MYSRVERIVKKYVMAAYFWTVLVFLLVLVDDLTFGWIFWALSLIHPVLSAAIAVAVYWIIGYVLIKAGTSQNAGRYAQGMLKRLMLDRKNPEIERRQHTLKRSVVSITVAVPLSLLLGGVVTALLLRRHGVTDDKQTLRVGFWLSGLYAAEFAIIHAFGIGGALNGLVYS